MSTNTAATATTTRREEGGRKRRIIGIAALATAGALVLGLGYAYFSDSALGEGSATAGTLDLTGAMAVDHTSGLTADDWVTTDVTNDHVPNLNPGDMVRIAGNLTNAGNKSAWIRTQIEPGTVDAAIAPDLYVFAGEDVPTQAEAMAAPDLTKLEGYLGTVADLEGASYVTEPLVIAGTGANAENTAVEDTTEATGKYDAHVVVYFDKDATNEAQAKGFELDVVVQAVQFRNNTTEPGEGQWSTVERGDVASGTWVPAS